MVITGLLVIGFVVLIIAPTVHRRVNARSRHTAESQRLDRATALRDSPAGASRSFARATDAVAVRDQLLLRGVRCEVIADEPGADLVYRREDDDVVSALLEERNGPGPN